MQTIRRIFIQRLAAMGAAINLEHCLADDAATGAGEYRVFEDSYRGEFDETPA